jgi:peptide/nickel transport system substrate-binding protein
MDDAQGRLDDVRRERSELENHLIDEYAAGKITRREFVRRGTVVGLSLPMLSFIISACGGDGGGSTGAQTGGGDADVRPGGNVRAAIIAPAAAIDPIKVADEGGLAVLGQSGEYLAWSDSKLELQPRLAESWEPNEDGSVWTFTIRQGVTFHDGNPMTAEDVAATFNRLVDPDVGSNALSALGGVLGPNGATATDESTVEFALEAPNGNFPYLVSSDNYNAIILPANYDGDFEQTFNGTGPWKLERYTPKQSVTYTKNPEYWDSERQPNADRIELRFYAEEQPSIIAFQGDQVDAISHFSVSGGKALLTDPNAKVLELRSSVHRQIHMRTDREPFQDARVRQALALLIDRQALVDGLFEGKADVGNDSPFAPVFPSADADVPQRERDVEQAKQLLADAGKADGFEVELTTWNGFEIPALAQLVQDAAAEAGIRITLNVTDPGTYYGEAVYGKSPWLDSVFGITDYGHRGVPNVFLGAPLRSDGTWNSAHFKNDEYDRLAAEYTASLDLDSQRATAGEIQTLLLEETPIVFPYFYYFLTATKPTLGGVETTAMGHIDLTRAGFTA